MNWQPDKLVWVCVTLHQSSRAAWVIRTRFKCHHLPFVSSRTTFRVHRHMRVQCVCMDGVSIDMRRIFDTYAPSCFWFCSIIYKDKLWNGSNSYFFLIMDHGQKYSATFFELSIHGDYWNPMENPNLTSRGFGWRSVPIQNSILG